MSTDAIFRSSLSTLLVEIFDGPPGAEAFILNPKDPGLARQMESISAETASTRPMPGQTTIAAHLDHVLYGLTLLNRWADGEENPWATADWSASWKRTVVNEAQWKDLCGRFRDGAARWKKTVATRTDWNPLTACGAIASCAHTAYHLGAIRQILAAMNANTAPT
ncbi:hypothetical protein Pan44_14790 [Caulifigura coniformis]|uniref:DinB superfamily protein n=1 Tax=Caulifigura coniformis TaxID=2527983 RepID=A0A517SBH7_9PLAN|nr:DinB family protein [Caulifigura coniformis]QDT53462.1 hypothetical protein Pan44_14790 [Caulifigura coniformis]